MTCNDSFPDRGNEPCAAARARPPAARREGVGSRDDGKRVVSGRRRTPGARKPISSSRPTVKFSTSQSLDNTQNAEGISIVREPVPQSGGTLRTDEEARRAPCAGGGVRATPATTLEGSKSTRPKVAEKGAQGLEFARCNDETAATLRPSRSQAKSPCSPKRRAAGPQNLDATPRCRAPRAPGAGDRLGVAELAAASGLTRAHFSRKFARPTGTSPAKYARDERLRRAASVLVANPRASIKQIARMAGFDDPNYFAKAFRRAFAAAPSPRGRAYRRSGATRPPANADKGNEGGVASEDAIGQVKLANQMPLPSGIRGVRMSICRVDGATVTGEGQKRHPLECRQIPARRRPHPSIRLGALSDDRPYQFRGLLEMRGQQRHRTVGIVGQRSLHDAAMLVLLEARFAGDSARWRSARPPRRELAAGCSSTIA